jgi:hypothetical protein
VLAKLVERKDGFHYMLANLSITDVIVALGHEVVGIVTGKVDVTMVSVMYSLPFSRMIRTSVCAITIMKFRSIASSWQNILVGH